MDPGSIMVSGFNTVSPIRGPAQQTGAVSVPKKKSDASFSNVLLQQTASASGVKFSKHALERIERRGLNFSQEDVKNISKGMDQVQAKGGNEALMIMGDAAMVVSASNRTVVTVMDRGTPDPTVITNIDSAVVL